MPAPTDELEYRIIEILTDLARERGRPAPPARSGAIPLDLDSLEKVELFWRIEQAFKVRLPDQALADVATVHELASAVRGTNGNGVHTDDGGSRPGPSLHGEGVDTAGARTLIDSLRLHAAAHPDQVHLHWLKADDDVRPLTYGELWDMARRTASGLLARGVRPGDRVALMIPTQHDFFATVCGIWAAGAAPVPLYPPFSRKRLDEYLQRQSRLLNNAAPPVLVVAPEFQAGAVLLKGMVSGLKHIVTPAAVRDTHPVDPVSISPNDIGLVQYTSGSTSLPRGVTLSHRNLLENIRAIVAAGHFQPHETMVSWLPLFHDMGLIGAWMIPLHLGMPLAVMGPERFLTRPERWLWALSNYSGNISPAPNFSWELCLRVPDDAIQGLDLSAWRLAMNGAEPVSPETITRFAERFGRYGLRPEAVYPVYGLAENALAVTFPRPGERPIILSVDREALSQRDTVQPAEDGTRFVSCGRPLPDVELRIVQSDTAVSEGRQGRIQFRSPSAMQGYLRNPEATAETMLADGWIDTGDLGFIWDGNLYPTGRVKDLIIRGGRNLHPQEIEEVARRIPGVRGGGLAAFGVTSPERGTESVVLVIETKLQGAEAHHQLEAEVRKRMLDVLGFAPDVIRLVKPGVVPRTSSGKVQRSECRRRYLADALKETPGGLPWRTMLASLAGHIGRLFNTSGERCFGAWTWTALTLAFAPTILLGRLGARPDEGARRATGAARLFGLMTGLQPHVVGRENLQSMPGGTLVVANHKSYLDGILLAAVVPGPVTFVVSDRILQHGVVKALLPYLPYIAVDLSGDPVRAREDVEAMTAALQAGRTLLIFPEGLNPAPGLRAFGLGGFQAAVRAQAPVVPVAIKGTDKVLPAATFWPRPGRIEVAAGLPLQASGQEWRDVVELAHECRERLSRLLG